VEEGRWIVEVQRKHRDAVEFLCEKLKDGGMNAGVATLISQALREGFEVAVNAEIKEIYSGNKLFAQFLTEFLEGKPFWLKADKPQHE
jgi:hypothetical protein